MRLFRTDLVPVLAIVAGGALGASLSFGFLGSWSEDVSGVTLGLLYENAATVEPVQARPEGAMTCTPNGVVYRTASVDGSRPDRVTVKILPDERRGRFLYRPLLCVDGVAVDEIDLVRNPQDYAVIERLDPDAAIALYGERGSAGAVLVTFKGDRP